MLSAFAVQTVLTADWLSRPLKPFTQYAADAAHDVADHVKNPQTFLTKMDTRSIAERGVGE